MELTPRQHEILGIIEKTLNEQGYPPTVREIGLATGLSSPASVQNHLTTLEQLGYIRRGVAKRRALELLHPHHGAMPRRDGGPAVEETPRRLPLVGRVAAGEPLLADENIEELLQVPGFLANGRDCFVLRVRGTSMTNAGILDGDLVVVQHQDDAQNGDIVVALLGDDATLKRFYREKDRVRLQPENDSMEPIFTKDPRIVGKVTGVMRRV